MTDTKHVPGQGLPWPQSLKELVRYYGGSGPRAARALKISRDNIRCYLQGGSPQSLMIRDKFRYFGWTDAELPERVYKTDGPRFKPPDPPPPPPPSLPPPRPLPPPVPVFTIAMQLLYESIPERKSALTEGLRAELAHASGICELQEALAKRMMAEGTLEDQANYISNSLVDRLPATRLRELVTAHVGGKVRI